MRQLWEKLILLSLSLAVIVCQSGRGADAKSGQNADRVEEYIEKMAAQDYAGRHYHQKLVEMGEPAVPALIEALDHGVPRVRYWAVAALAKIGDDRAVEPVIKCLEDADPTVRAVTCWHLRTWIERHKVVDSLVRMLGDSEEKVQKWAYRALSDTWEGSPAVRRSIMDLLDADAAVPRGWAFRIAREKEYTKAVPVLQQMVEDPEEEVRYSTVRALAAIRGEKALPVVKTALKEDGSSLVRAGAVYELRRWFDRPEVKNLVLETLDDTAPYVRGWAMNVLAEKRCREALPRIMNLLGSEDEDLRFDALRAVARIKGPDSLKILGDLLREDPSPVVREGALRSCRIFDSKTPRCAELLIEGLSDENEDVRAAAAALLRKGFGEFFGYRADGTVGKRQEAIEQWKTWYEERKGELEWSSEQRRFVVGG